MLDTAEDIGRFAFLGRHLGLFSDRNWDSLEFS